MLPGVTVTARNVGDGPDAHGRHRRRTAGSASRRFRRAAMSSRRSCQGFGSADVPAMTLTTGTRNHPQHHDAGAGPERVGDGHRRSADHRGHQDRRVGRHHAGPDAEPAAGDAAADGPRAADAGHEPGRDASRARRTRTSAPARSPTARRCWSTACGTRKATPASRGRISRSRRSRSSRCI